MFGLRNLTEAQPRWKNGQPHHSTMGVARANSIQVPARGESTCARGPMRSMAYATKGTPSTTLVQKRRVMSRSSGFSSCAGVTVIGSSAMPQIGHAPGPSRTISGCMGRSTASWSRAGGSSGSSAMPHFGQAPGCDWRTSGSIGQT